MAHDLDHTGHTGGRPPAGDLLFLVRHLPPQVDDAVAHDDIERRTQRQAELVNCRNHVLAYRVAAGGRRIVLPGVVDRPWGEHGLYEIEPADDPDHERATHDRNVFDPVLHHQGSDVRQCRLLRHHDDILRHDAGDLRRKRSVSVAGIAGAVGQPRRHFVPEQIVLAQDADQRTVLVDDRQYADARIHHHSGRIAQSRRDGDSRHARIHDVLGRHLRSLPRLPPMRPSSLRRSQHSLTASKLTERRRMRL